MTAKLRGYYARLSADQPPAPRLAAWAFPTGDPTIIRFLIDTGADLTILAPQDARTTLGRDRYDAIDFEGSPDRIELIGIGSGGAAVYVTIPLLFVRDDGTTLVLQQRLAVAQELHEASSLDLGQAPSLLGRDFLNHFEVLLSAVHNTVELAEIVPFPQ